VTAEDVGTSARDMETIAEQTKRVSGLSRKRGGSGDPSPFTALGVVTAIEVACERVFGSAALEGRSIALAGLGHVGAHIARRLAAAGAELLVADVDERKRALAGELGARAVQRPSTAEIVVNCTSVGLADPGATFKTLPLEADSLGAGSCVVDMVYRDGGTRLLEAARTRGAVVIDGLEILIAQGAASFERWTGRTAPRQAMRAAVRTIAST
jgi:shikimate 5-dehydrogenase